MPARMVGAPAPTVYATRKSDILTNGFPTYEEPPVDYRVSTNGIIAGYSGHLPFARDKIGASPVGGTRKFADAEHPLGQPRRYTTKQEPPYHQDSFMSKDLEVRHVRQHVDYCKRVDGILPGYAGFVPGGNHKYGSSPFKATSSLEPTSS